MTDPLSNTHFSLPFPEPTKAVLQVVSAMEADNEEQGGPNEVRVPVHLIAQVDDFIVANQLDEEYYAILEIHGKVKQGDENIVHLRSLAVDKELFHRLRKQLGAADLPSLPSVFEFNLEAKDNSKHPGDRDMTGVEYYRGNARQGFKTAYDKSLKDDKSKVGTAQYTQVKDLVVWWKNKINEARGRMGARSKVNFHAIFDMLATYQYKAGRDFPSGLLIIRNLRMKITEIGKWAGDHTTWKEAQQYHGKCPVKPPHIDEVVMLEVLGECGGANPDASKKWGLISKRYKGYLDAAHLDFLLTDVITVDPFWKDAGVYDHLEN